MMRPCLVLFATMDPRGNKIGGIETHIRHILRNHPADLDLILTGIDEFGDLTPGIAVPLSFDGRPITFLPLAHVPAEEARVSARTLRGSTTLRFVLGGLRHLGALKCLIGARPASADLPRVEFAILPKLLGLPFALTIHSDLTKAAKTDSLLKRYGAVKRWSEGLAFRAAAKIYAVNADILAAVATHGAAIAAKSSVMIVPVDTRIFRPSPFPAGDGTLHLVYAGRFDEVKDPTLMFLTIAALKARLGGAVVFHVIGPADPQAIRAFGAIRDVTILHGPQDAAGVAAIIARTHIGLMTSHSEGMPCFLLETLASGRAFAAMHLPTFEALIRPGLTGTLTPRDASIDASAQALAAAIVAVWQGIEAGSYDPIAIARMVEPYALANLFVEMFDTHARLRDGARTSPPALCVQSKAA